MSARRAALVVLLVLVGVASIVSGAGTAARADHVGDPVDRVLIVSLPTVSWADLDAAPTPNLDALLAESAVADLSVRAVNRLTTRGDGYGTIGAGTRVRGAGTVDGLAFGADEPYGGRPAAETFESRTGVRTGSGLVHLGYPSILRLNAGLRFDAEVGALGDALDAAGIGRAVVANADEELAGTTLYERTAALALADGDGAVPGGKVGGDLVAERPGDAFGIRMDTDSATAAFTDAWRDRAVVLVEASDLARVDSFRTLATPDRIDVLAREALERTDALVGALLEHVDPERDAVLVVGPYHARTGPHLTVAALRAPGLDPGLLRSGSTRRSGFVSLVDVAPTVLDLLDVERPASMEGRPFERGATAGSVDDRRSDLVEADRAARFRDRRINPFWTTFIALNVVLCVGAVVATRRGGRRQWLRLGALSLLGVLPMTYVSGLLPFHRWGQLPFWAFLAAGGVAVGMGALVAPRRHSIDPLLAVLGLVVGVLLVDVVLGAPLQLNTVAGYSPTVAGRFAGFGNLAFAQLAAAGVLLATFVAHRLGGRPGVVAALGLLAIVLVLDGAPMWGSDVGGVLTLVPTIGVVAAVLLGWRLRIRMLLIAAAVTLAVIGVFGALDLSRPAERRTHLGRLLEQIGDQGFEALETVVLRKLDANLSVLTSSIFTLMVPVVLGFVGYLLWRSPAPLRALRREVPEVDAALAGLLVAAVLGFALNDSGIAVPSVMLGVINTSLVYLIARPGPPGRRAPTGVVAAADDQPAAAVSR